MIKVFWGKVRHGDKRGRLLGYPTANMQLHQPLEEGVYISKVKIHAPVILNESEESQQNVILVSPEGTHPGSDSGQARMTKKEVATSPTAPRNDNKWLPALTFIGAAKTFGKKEVKAESFLLDFSGNLYDTTLSVQLIYKMRGNQTFPSEKELIEQMKEDELTARQFFSKHC